ncbi:MAG: TraB family protein [Polyangiaceae bacterium]|nr:TraB family protein [Polyangiaceae bacterium]
MRTQGNVTQLALPEKDIYIVGTAHVSQASVAEVEGLIDGLGPNTVCVELDELRYRALTDDSYWKSLDVADVVKKRRVGLVFASIVLASIQKRVGNKLGIRPGAEMLAAARRAQANGAELVLADRSIQITFQRTWHNLGPLNRLKLLAFLVMAPFSAIEDEIDAASVERLKEEGSMNDMMSEFAKVMPQVKEPLIDERNQYLMSMVREAPGSKVVAVVGAAHVSGMVADFDRPIDRAALLEVPRPPVLQRALRWAFPVALLGLVAATHLRADPPALASLLLAWCLPTALFGLVAASVAGARPLTLVLAALIAPLASLGPALPLESVTGRIEARLRRPTPEDGQRILDDVGTVRGLYRNRAARVLLVALLSRVGAIVGGVVGGAWVLWLVL